MEYTDFPCPLFSMMESGKPIALNIHDENGVVQTVKKEPVLHGRKYDIEYGERSLRLRGGR